MSMGRLWGRMCCVEPQPKVVPLHLLPIVCMRGWPGEGLAVVRGWHSCGCSGRSVRAVTGWAIESESN